MFGRDDLRPQDQQQQLASIESTGCALPNVDAMRAQRRLPRSYHCKVMIVDELWTSVGSTNFATAPS